MRFLNCGIVGVFLLAALGAQAAYEVELTFNNGAVRTTGALVIQSGSVVLASENLTVPFAQIKSANFSFEGLSVEECDVLIRRGAYTELLNKVNTALAPVKEGLGLAGNIDVYLQYKMRALFWVGKTDDLKALTMTLIQKKSSYASLAKLYNVLVMLDKKDVAGAKILFGNIPKTTSYSLPMSEFIRGRFAMIARENETAIQYFSNVIVYYGRDPEWFPAATFYEGLVSKKTGYLESATNVAEELTIVYPDTYWGNRAKELK